MKAKQLAKRFVKELEMTEKEYQIFDYVVSGMLIRHKDWRAGQGTFNALQLVCPNLADEICGNPLLDPFYNNDNIGPLIKWLKSKRQ